MKIITHHPKQKTPIMPRRGQVWQPKDAAANAVVVANVGDTRVYLQYVDALDVSFSMDLSAFIQHYTKSPKDYALPAGQIEQIQPFFA